ncbi:glycosyltransferase family 4 protein [Candidatus Parcubacteria bacterium]|nr:glycosyltransferase family 4 protein [Candidatus Parcubacteria bacterium]
MLIGIDASRANKDHKSGTEWYSYYVIRWLAKIDSKNQYILYSDKPLTGGLLDLTTKQHFDTSPASISLRHPLLGKERDGVRFDKKGFQELKSPYDNFKAKVLKWRFPFCWTQIRFSWEMLWSKPDVLFIPAHALPIIHPKRSIATIHDIGFEKERKLYSSDYLGPRGGIFRYIFNLLFRLFTLGRYGATVLDYHSWSSRFSLKHSKKIITVSNFSKKEIEEAYRPQQDKISVVYHGYNKFLYKKIDQAEEIKKVLEKHDINGPYIFYVGRLEKKKNTPALIEAYAIAKEDNKEIKHKLVLAGDASHGYDEVKYMIGEFDLEDDVIITGWVPEVDMPYLYNGAGAFIFPSLYEGFGIPLLQAMACGTPIIASRAGSIPEIAGKAAILFDPNNVKSMAEAISRIILDDNLRQNLIKNGFDRIKDFSWERCARETLAEIEKL